jgi:hypothetical protein
MRKLAGNPFQRQLDEARAEWKRRRPPTEYVGDYNLVERQSFDGCSNEKLLKQSERT